MRMSDQSNVLFLIGEVVTGYDNTLKHIETGPDATTDKLFKIGRAHV